jgi:hypothetical protein
VQLLPPRPPAAAAHRARRQTLPLPSKTHHNLHPASAARPGEVHGKDYFFVSKAQFEEWIAGGHLLEHAVVYGEYKGIPMQQVGVCGGVGGWVLRGWVSGWGVGGAASTRASRHRRFGWGIEGGQRRSRFGWGIEGGQRRDARVAQPGTMQPPTARRSRPPALPRRHAASAPRNPTMRQIEEALARGTDVVLRLDVQVGGGGGR